MPNAFWFTRDLRIHDHVALNACIESSKSDSRSQVIPCYLLDLDEYQSMQGIRQHSLSESLLALSQDVGPIAVFHSPAEMAKAFAEAGVRNIFHTRSFDPQGIDREVNFAEQMESRGIKLHGFDSYYAVRPGLIQKPDGSPYRVYTPFQKAWQAEGWLKPQKLHDDVEWKNLESKGIPKPTKPSPIQVIAGERFALRTWGRFKARALDSYDEQRNRADLSGTSHLSHALAFGEIHPRTLLHELGDGKAHEVFRKELAWREFYADVLFHNPNSLTDYYDPKFSRMRYDVGEKAEAKLVSWKQGKTGYPMVDAGMRQLLAEGWIHNRVRMIVASFLVKDLHLEWQTGAEWFEQNLSDFDPASNSHGWQWTAGCGTDASPYYRVFNPVLQGLKFDPEGEYVRKYIPELRHIPGAAVHEPWNLLDGYLNGYPAQIVQHDQERIESLARLEELKHL